MRAEEPRLPLIEDKDWDQSLEKYRGNLIGDS